MLFQVANAMNLSNAEKEVLGFLHGKIGHDPKANVSLRALHRHFAEIPASSFELICDGLIEKDLIGNFFLDQLVFTPEGLAVAQALRGLCRRQRMRRSRLPPMSIWSGICRKWRTIARPANLSCSFATRFVFFRARAAALQQLRHPGAARQ